MHMGCPEHLKPDMSVTDLAYCILKTRGKATHFKQLIDEILRVKEWNGEGTGRLIAQIHTEINLDSRFLHHGAGEWGLRDWQPRSGGKLVRIRPQTAAAGSASAASSARQRHDLLPLDEEEDYEGYEREEESPEESESEYADYDQEEYLGEEE